MSQTIKQFSEAVLGSKNETFRKNNPHLFGSGAPQKEHCKSATDTKVVTANQSARSAEEKLNKTERRWLQVLRTGQPKAKIGIQNITLRLSTGVRYTPDFSATFVDEDGMVVVFYETKGPHRFREKGILKCKMAAVLYPWFDFVLVQWRGGQWDETKMSKV
jgi:hypothetical protein